MSDVFATVEAMKPNFVISTGLVTCAFLWAVPRFGKLLQDVKYENESPEPCWSSPGPFTRRLAVIGGLIWITGIVLFLQKPVLAVASGICIVIFNNLLLMTTLVFTLSVWYFKTSGRHLMGMKDHRRRLGEHQKALGKAKGMVEPKHWKKHLSLSRETPFRW